MTNSETHAKTFFTDVENIWKEWNNKGTEWANFLRKKYDIA